MSVFEPSPARRGLELLLKMHPHLDVVDVRVPGVEIDARSPWLLVDLGQPSQGASNAYAIWRFAIWRTTGAVHRIGSDGAVDDDAIIEPQLEIESDPGDVAYLECLAAHEAAYWYARQRGWHLSDKQIGDLLRVVVPHLERSRAAT
jgi:hypothetical protein